MKDNIKWIVILVLAVVGLGVLCYFQFFNHDPILIHNNGTKLNMTELKANVNHYIENQNLEIGVIITCDDSDYYFSIIEKGSGSGAYELMVDPYTGYVYPEQGPNMMWNEKYMHHMMNWDNDSNGTEITKDDAINYANQYLETNNETNKSVTGQGLHYYGYYTFQEFDKDGNLIGLICVNSYNGQVWEPNWQGSNMKMIPVNVN